MTDPHGKNGREPWGDGKYPSGDKDRDAVIELLCDEWPIDVDFREWGDRCTIVMRLLEVLDKNRLTVIDLGEPVSPDDLRELLSAKSVEECPWCCIARDQLRAATNDPTAETTCTVHRTPPSGRSGA